MQVSNAVSNKNTFIVEKPEKGVNMLSVIIPVYNVNRYLRRCIDSIIAQSFTDWEVILIDDGSTDGSDDICDEYARNESRISAIHQENKGVSAARNRGIENAKGSHVIFIDSDDWIDPEMFRAMMTDNDYDMVVCSFTRVNVMNDCKYHSSSVDLWPDESKERFVSSQPYYDVLCRNGTLWNKIIKAELISDIRFDTNQKYGEDTVFLTKVLGEVKTVCLIKKPYYYYFNNRPGNVVSAPVDERLFDYLNNARIIYDEVQNKGAVLSGVLKIHMTVLDVIKKISSISLKESKAYISDCIVTIRYPSLKHILSYVFKKELQMVSFRKKIIFLLYFFFPKLMILVARIRMKKN